MFETGATNAKSNDIVLTIINDGNGDQCGINYNDRRRASIARLRTACRHYAPTATKVQIDEAADLIHAYYAMRSNRS